MSIAEERHVLNVVQQIKATYTPDAVVYTQIMVNLADTSSAKKVQTMANDVKYFVKAPISGWHEVDEEHFNSFKKHILQHSNPSHCTPVELAEKITRKEEC